MALPRPNYPLMVTLKGLALIAELVVAAGLVIALAGFGLRRTTPWLACCVMTFTMLIAVVLVIIESSSS
jgi:hypothetical protein